MFRSFFPILAPEGEGGAGGGKTDTMEVELLSGVKVTLPKADAEKEIAKRQEVKEARRQRDEEFGKLKAEKEAGIAAADEKRQRAEADAAVKAGEYDKARELLTKSSNEKIDRLSARYRERHLESAIAQTPGIVPGAAKLIAGQLASGCRFNIEADTLDIIGADGKPRMGADGKPLSADALIVEFLDANPYLRAAAGSPGSGAGGSGQKQTGPLPKFTKMQAARGEVPRALVESGDYEITG